MCWTSIFTPVGRRGDFFVKTSGFVWKLKWFYRLRGIEKIIVASGSKVAIGDSLQEAITNLLSKSAVNIEITNTEDVEGMIQAIIKANKNLTESNGRNDWKMMGADIKELQSLIDSLEKMVKKENSKFNVTTSDF